MQNRHLEMLLLHFVALFVSVHSKWVQAICQQCFLVSAVFLHCLHPVIISHIFSNVLLCTFSSLFLLVCEQFCEQLFDSFVDRALEVSYIDRKISLVACTALVLEVSGRQKKSLDILSESERGQWEFSKLLFWISRSGIIRR